MKDEGVIKFACRWKKTPPLSRETVADLIVYRGRLYRRGLIGCDPDGIGFGNLSIRLAQGHQFLISASQTGHLPAVDARHFVTVVDYRVEKNWLACEGPAEASSESLTHALIYEVFPDAAAVIHVHHHEAWQRLQSQVPVSRKDVPYGTPQMAGEIRRLANESRLREEKILVMGGHEDGIVAFGKDLSDAYSRLIRAVGSGG